MTLRAWVKEIGIGVLYRELNVHPTTISYWIDGKSCPRAHHMVRIKKLSKGRVTYAAMIEPVAKRNAK